MRTVRLVHFMQELIDYQDYYERDCQLTREAIYDIAEVPTTE